jgi:uncharacterized phage-associated protein
VKKVELIAFWFINKLHPAPLKLQKLLYFAQGTHFALYDEELFEDDLEAWVHGPVVRDIYFKFKNYGKRPIDKIFEGVFLDKKTIEIVEHVAENYGKYDDCFLEELIHNQAPWIIAREGLDPDERNDKKIPKYVINDYFVAQMYKPTLDAWD